jgi:hypothetical protein
MWRIGCSTSYCAVRGLTVGREFANQSLSRVRQARQARSVSRKPDVRPILLSMVMTFVGVISAQGQSTDESLQIYATKVGEGYGIYLANGLVVTAAHKLATGVRPMVRIGGLDIAGKVIKTEAKEDVDLALLMVEAQRLPLSVRMRRIEFCEKVVIGEPVIIVVPEGTDRSTIVSPSVLPAELRTKFSTLIDGAAGIAESGAGLFRVGRKCLLGIVSHSLQGSSKDGEASPPDVVKNFVPASTISAFIPNWFRGWGVSGFGR